MISVLRIFMLLRYWRLQNFFACAYTHKRHLTSLKKPAAFCRQQRKPDWVKQEIIRLKALMRDAGCRVLVLLRFLLNAIERQGKPANIRTDNEAVFTSRLFRLTMRLLIIRHQQSELHCSWQNGRIERLFGALKQELDQISVSGKPRLISDNSAMSFSPQFVGLVAEVVLVFGFI